MSRKKPGPGRRSPSSFKARQATERALAQGLALQRAGDAPGARERFEEVLRRDPRNPDALHLLGLIEAQAGRLAEGARLMARAVAAKPGMPFFHHNLGNALYQLGRHAEAACEFAQVLRLQPGMPEAHFSLGNALAGQGRHAEAISEYRQAVGRRPDFADAHNNLGNALLAEGDGEGAVAAFRRARDLAPKLFSAQSNLGNALLALGRFEEAVAELRRALELQPRRPESMLNLGKALVLHEQEEEGLRWLRAVRDAPGADLRPAINAGVVLYRIGHYGDAIAAFQQVLAIDLRNVNAQVGLGFALTKQGDLKGAEKAFRETLALDTEYALAHLGLGSLYAQWGRFEDAVAAYQRGIDLKPSDVVARVGLVEAKGLQLDAPLLDEMRQLAEGGELTPDQSVSLSFALGRALDAEGEYEEAFGYFERGNQLKGAEFEPAEHRAFVDRLIATFSSAIFAGRRGSGSDNPGPILILGMPRSGTTLVEQILASHPNVAAGGELTYLNELAEGLSAEVSDLEYPEAAAAASQEQISRLGEEYTRRLGSLSDGARHVTDKMPHNFLRLGLIGLCLPEARVIHVRRDPLDTCLSIYFHNFEGWHPYAYDLAHLGAYYREYERLMEHWRRVLPLRMLEVRYEALVANQAEKTRELLTYCGLPWDEGCLRFWETERGVSTASQWQVRQPVYTRSIERWRHYAAHLGSLKEALGG